MRTTFNEANKTGIPYLSMSKAIILSAVLIKITSLWNIDVCIFTGLKYLMPKRYINKWFI